MINTIRCICFAVLAPLLLAAASSAARPSSLPTGFTDTTVNRPDGRPWDRADGVEFAADGRMFVWERSGRVWLLAGAEPRSEPLIDLSDEVSTLGTLGLTGFALDPQFERNGYLYLFYAVDPQHLANCDAPAAGAAICRDTYRAGQHASSGATIGRLVRFQLVRPAGAQDFRTADTVNYASRRVLLGETAGVGHLPTGCVVTDGGNGPAGLAFGSDGTLFAGCGDGAGVSGQDAGSHPDTQYREALAARLMTSAENVGAFRAQFVDSLSGKILRIDPATGNGVPSNPFYEPSAPRSARSRVWVLGLRDPQHFTVRPGSGSARPADGKPGTLYIGDVGSGAWEALVVARDGRMNFGWPLYEGVGDDTTDYADLPAFNLLAPNPLFPKQCAQQYFLFRDLITADSVHASWPNPCQPSMDVPATDDVFVRERPMIDWLHRGAEARWAAFDKAGRPLALPLGARAPNGSVVSGSLFGGTSSVGGVWYQGSSFPAPFRDVYYHADSGGGWIKAFAFDANDNPLWVRDFLSAASPPEALGNDPRTGDLYYISGLFGSEVHRLSYSSKTATPVASASPSFSQPANSQSTAAAGSTARTAGPSTTVTRSPARKMAAAAASGTSNWSNSDIGAVNPAGSFTLNGSTFTVKGSGVDVYNAADAFQFVYQTLTGDGSITARVVSQTNTDPWAKAGVMLRETLAAGSTNVFVPVTPANGIVFQGRATTNGATTTLTHGPLVAAPYWVQLVRAGNTFSAFASPDGTTWTAIGQTTISMASQIFVGLAVSSHHTGTLSTAVFDNVTASATAPPPPDTQPPTVPAGLAVTNTTASSVSLSWSASTDLPNPGGAGMGGYYVYRNGNTTTPIATVSGTSFTDTGLAASTRYSYQVAAFDKASPVNVSAPSGAVSATTQVAVASNWSNSDIGAVNAAGSSALNGGTYTVMGSGVDVYSSADAFQFDYQSLVGDGSITARVVSQTNTDPWAKAGVMFRETLAIASTNAFVPVTPTNGIVFQGRPTTGGASTTFTHGPLVTAPYWVRLVRAGNTFSAFISPDGTTWTALGQTTISMASQIFVGLAVSSHHNGNLSTAVFDNVVVNGQIALTVTPYAAAVTTSQTHQFAATVSGGATWSVDGVAGGNGTVGTISASGLYTAGSAPGAHSIVATSIVDPSQSGSATVGVTDLAGVYTYHNDLSRDGANSQEYALTPADVNTTNFGKLFSCPVDGAIYTQPLWVPNLNVNGRPHNVVLVATQHDSLYAFDADASPCAQLWTVSLIDPSHGGTGAETTVPSGPTGGLVGQGFGDITPEVGVTGTPVIDPTSLTLYVVSKSLDSGGATIYQRLHAIDLTTGNERTGSPVTIAGTYPGSGDGGSSVTFNPRQENQRAGLALVNGTVYMEWGSHEDDPPWYGWIMGYAYNGSTFTQTAVLNSTPNNKEGGIWMGGGAPAVDSSSNLYVLTGNGVFDAASATAPNNDYGDSLLKLTSNLTVAQYFTPSDQKTLFQNDGDFASGGAAILADLPAGSPVTHLIMGGGKDQSLYVLNRDLLGGLGDANAVQKISLGASIFTTGAYWNENYYVAGAGGPLKAFRLNATVPMFNPGGSSTNTYPFPGAGPSVSAAGTAHGVVWTLDNSRYCTRESNACGPAVLHAHDAANVANELWNSSMVSADVAGNAVKFTVPTVANGKIYVGTRGNNAGGLFGSTTVSGELDVYGLKP